MAAAAETANEPDPHWARHTITPPTRRYAGWPSPSMTTSRSCRWQCTSSANAGYEGLPHGPTSVAGLRAGPRAAPARVLSWPGHEALAVAGRLDAVPPWCGRGDGLCHRRAELHGS